MLCRSVFPRPIFRRRLTKQLSLNQIEACAPEQGAGAQEGERAAEANKITKGRKKFKATSYPASRPMHKEVGTVGRSTRAKTLAAPGPACCDVCALFSREMLFFGGPSARLRR